MAQLGDTIRLVELVCARLCHDLGGLIGTVGNALDMVAEDAGRDNEILAFAVSASNALTQRLRLMRAAWGPETDPMELSALLTLATPVLAARRIRLDARALPPDSAFSPATGRLLLNVILLACDCLPRGGAVLLFGGPDDLFIRIQGQDAVWPAGLSACLLDQDEAIATLNTARSVQMPLTALLAIACGLRVSPVLGPTSGIEALRLTTS